MNVSRPTMLVWVTLIATELLTTGVPSLAPIPTSPTASARPAEIFAGNGQTGTAGDGGPATDAQLFRPVGLTIDESGNLYIAECDHHVVRRVSPTGVIDRVAGDGTFVPGFSGDGGSGTAAKINCPFSVTTDEDGDLYIADTFNNRIRKVDATGTISTIAGTGNGFDTGDGGPAAQASLLAPAELEFDSDGRLLVASGAYIRRIGSDGVISTIAGLGAGSRAVYGIARWKDDEDGTPAIDAAFADSGGMAFGPDGSLYFASFWDNRVLMIDRDGLIHRVAGSGSSADTRSSSGDGGQATDAELARPADVAVGPDGSLYILEHYGNVRHVSLDGIIETVDIGWQYDQAQGVAADDQYLYIADREGAVVLRVPFSEID